MTLDDLGTALGLLIEGGTLLLVVLIAIRWVITRWPSAALVTGSASPPPVSQGGQVAQAGQGGSATHIVSLETVHTTDGLNPTRPSREQISVARPAPHMDLNDPATIWMGGPQRAPHWTDIQ